MKTTTQFCKVGEITALGPQKAGRACGNHGYVYLQAAPARWVVRYMDGTILRDKTFFDANSAKAFWDSLPDYN